MILFWQLAEHSSELYEAAQILCNCFQNFRYITIPHCEKRLLLSSLLVVNGLQVFDLIYVMTWGGLQDGNAGVLATWMYFNTFIYHHVGYGSAIAWIMTIVILLIVTYIKIMSKNSSARRKYRAMKSLRQQHVTLMPYSHAAFYKTMKICGYALLIFFAFLWLFPFFIVILTSLKSQGDIISRGVFAFPEKIVLQNFANAWHTGQFSVFYRNSLLISVIKVPAGIFVASMAAYPLAKYNFRLRDTLFLFFFFLVGIGIPIHVTLLPLSLLLKKIGLLDTLAGLFFPYIAFGLPFQIMVCRGFFRGLPSEFIYLDSARIDGCSEFKIYWKIVLPLAKTTAIAALFIIDFLATWNEFLMASFLST